MYKINSVNSEGEKGSREREREREAEGEREKEKTISICSSTVALGE